MDSLRNIVSGQAVKMNNVKNIIVFKMSDDLDSIIMFTSSYDKNGYKIRDEIYSKKELSETWMYEDECIKRIDSRGGKSKIYSYHYNQTGEVDRIRVSRQNKGDAVFAASEYQLLYSNNRLSRVIISDTLIRQTDTIEYSYSVNDSGWVRTKSCKSYSVEGNKHSVSEYLSYIYNSNGQLCEIELVEINIGSKRFTMRKKISYNDLGLVKEVRDENNEVLHFDYIYY
jgi:hypothetical protein